MNIHLWKDRLTLDATDELRHESSKTSGFMQEEDIDTYSIIAADGTKTGTVTIRDHTAVKGFRRTIHVRQVDVNGKTVVDEHLSPSRGQ